MDIYGFIMICCGIALMNTRNTRAFLFILTVLFTCVALSFYFGSFSSVEKEGVKVSFALFASSLWILNITWYFLHVRSSTANNNIHLPKG